MHLRLLSASPAIDLQTHCETRMFVCIITFVTYFIYFTSTNTKRWGWWRRGDVADASALRLSSEDDMKVKRSTYRERPGVYRSFLQRAGHCISKKPLNKDCLYENVSQLYLTWTNPATLQQCPARCRKDLYLVAWYYWILKATRNDPSGSCDMELRMLVGKMSFQTSCLLSFENTLRGTQSPSQS